MSTERDKRISFCKHKVLSVFVSESRTDFFFEKKFTHNELN